MYNGKPVKLFSINILLVGIQIPHIVCSGKDFEDVDV
jgi:hypothetical protein